MKRWLPLLLLLLAAAAPQTQAYAPVPTLELISGRDYITGEETSRFWAAVGVVAGVFPAGKGAVKALTKVDDVVDLAKPAAKATPPVNILPSSGGRFIVDPKGNIIPLKPGETFTSSPNAQWIQVRDAAGNPTGLRLDGPHPLRTHPDPRAQVPHGHVPGVTNPDGTPWLPVNR